MTARLGNPLRQLSAPASGLTTEGLTHTVRNGMLSNATLKLGTQVCQLAAQVVLARLLSPHDYGLVAIVTVFAGFTLLFTDLGVGGAVVHEQNLTPTYISTAFWINIVSGLLLTLGFAALSYPVASFYGDHRLVVLMLIVSLTFTLASSTVHVALLERAFQFRWVGLAEFFATVVSLGVGVTAAALGAGPVSLSLMFVTTGAARTLICWSLVGGIPSGRPSRRDARAIFIYSRGLIGFGIINYFSANIDNLTIGRISGVAPLAFYSRAYNLMLLPIGQVQQILGRVLFPALASLQSDRIRLRNAFERVLPLMVSVGAPVSLGIAACSPSLVVTLYGSQWSSVAPLLEILSLAGVPIILGGALSVGLQATGQTGTQFRRGLVTMIGTLIAVGVGIHWGPTGVAIGLAIRAYATLPLNYSPCARVMELRTRLIVVGAAGPILAAAGMAGLTTSLNLLGVGWQVLLLQLICGVITYPLLLRAIAPKTYAEFLNLFNRRRGARTSGRHRHDLRSTTRTLP